MRLSFMFFTMANVGLAGYVWFCRRISYACGHFPGQYLGGSGGHSGRDLISLLCALAVPPRVMMGDLIKESLKIIRI